MNRENFPVGSLLLPRALRPHVAAYYAFARAADDIADASDLSAQEKHASLTAFRDALLWGGQGAAEATRLAQSLSATGADPRNASRLLDAFDQDVDQTRYATWADLMAYCDMSAAPVGRFLIDLHGGARPGGVAASDALCAALQVLNHLQDCGDDYRLLGRVYLPQDWLAGRETDLGAKVATPVVRAALDKALDGVDILLETAAALPRLIRHKRLAREAAGIHALAVRLSAKLRHADPLAGRVALSKAESAWVFLKGAVVWPQSASRRSSFYWGMRLLGPERRAALFALYDFCHAVDDVADGVDDDATKRRKLADLRQSQHWPATFVDAVNRYGLAQADVDGLLDGMESDVGGRVALADEAALATYCDRVAGTVGRMASRIFGTSDDKAAPVAYHLGQALQRTNILRDVVEDQTRGRLYLPQDLLARHGVDPDHDIPNQPGFPAVCDDLAETARAHYVAAWTALAACGPAMRPARIMAAVYGALLDDMTARRWRFGGKRPRLPVWRKVWLVLRHGVFG